MALDMVRKLMQTGWKLGLLPKQATLWRWTTHEIFKYNLNFQILISFLKKLLLVRDELLSEGDEASRTPVADPIPSIEGMVEAICAEI